VEYQEGGGKSPKQLMGHAGEGEKYRGKTRGVREKREEVVGKHVKRIKSRNLGWFRPGR